MRYHAKECRMPRAKCGVTYFCSHPVYDRCTLFKKGKRGICVIQQRYDEKTKRTWWTEIDRWIGCEIYIQPGFWEYFEKNAEEPANGIYPTVTVRQIMWALRMKPLPKMRWETVFDRKRI